MRPVRQVITDTSDQTPVILDRFINPMQISLLVDLLAAATGTFTAQYTYDDPFSFADQAAFIAGAKWIDVSGMAAATADAEAQIVNKPVTAVKIKFAAITGSARFTVIQSGGGSG